MQALHHRLDEAVTVVDQDEALVGGEDEVLAADEAEGPPRHVAGDRLAEELLARIEDATREKLDVQIAEEHRLRPPRLNTGVPE